MRRLRCPSAALDWPYEYSQTALFRTCQSLSTDKASVGQMSHRLKRWAAKDVMLQTEGLSEFLNRGIHLTATKSGPAQWIAVILAKSELRTDHYKKSHPLGHRNH